MLELDDVFELSLWGLELIGDSAASADSHSQPAGRAAASLLPPAARGPARRVADPFSPVSRLPYLATEKRSAGASRVPPRRRAADEKPSKKS